MIDEEKPLSERLRPYMTDRPVALIPENVIKDIESLESELVKFRKENEKLRWYDLGCQGKMDLLPLIEKAQRAEVAESRLSKAQVLVERWRKIPPINNVTCFTCADELEEALGD